MINLSSHMNPKSITKDLYRKCILTYKSENRSTIKCVMFIIIKLLSLLQLLLILNFLLSLLKVNSFPITSFGQHENCVKTTYFKGNFLSLTLFKNYEVKSRNIIFYLLQNHQNYESKHLKQPKIC